MAIRTYTVGDQSGVKRLDELTGSWQNVPLNIVGLPAIILYDVMTDPLDPNKVFVCGQRDAAGGNPGIFWSANGGVNWNKCIGDVASAVPNSGDQVTEIWVVDSLIIYATSNNGFVFKSTDGGVTFNNTIGNPGDQNGAPGWAAGNNELISKSLHFIDDMIGVVTMGVLGQEFICKTIDGGINWTFVDITALGVVGQPNGIHLDATQTTIVVTTNNGLWTSTDSGVTYVNKSIYRLLHLTWVNDLILWAYGNGSGRIWSSDGGITWLILNVQAGGLLDRAGHHYDTAPPHAGFFAENADIFTTLDSSQTGTLSQANQFPGGIQAVWTGIADVFPPIIPGCTDPTATNFNPLATADCSGVVGGPDLSCCSYNPDPGDPCECPPGYTYDPIANDCTLVETTPANCLPNTILIDRGDQNNQYSSQGANFYPDVTTLPFPLSDIVIGINANNLQDANLTPLLAIQNVDNPLWGGPLNPNAGRLFDIGVWTNLAQISGNEQPVNEWIGFTACVTVPVTGTYSIGFGGDNRVRLTLDGAPLVEVGANGGSYAFWYWSVIEVTLTAGQHVITIEGFNLSGPASFAAEIYSADVATLIPMTTPAQLAAVTVWSTGDFIPGVGEVPSIPFDLGEESGCSCPDGWVLSNCNGELDCIQTTVVPAEPCNCYLATNCDDPGDTELITIDPLIPPLDLNATYTFVEFPGKCWTIELSTDCGGNPGEVILLNTGFIDDVDTLGIQGNVDYNWKLVENGNGPIAPQNAYISRQDWWSYVPYPYGVLPQTISIPPVCTVTPCPSVPSPTPQALWITQSPTSQPLPANPDSYPLGIYTTYELQFTLPLGFVPNVNFDILTDNHAVITLNGNQIGDNSNPLMFPKNWNIAYNFGTSNPAHFVPGVQTLSVRIFDATASGGGSTSNAQGFALMGSIESLVLPDPSTAVTVEEVFIDCDDCLGVCYQLTDCEGLLDPIITNDTLSGDLSPYVGEVITIVTCPETCWTVEVINCPLNVDVTINVVDSFPDCVTCLPSDPPPPPLVIRNRTVKPGYDTPGCSPKYVEKISCAWSESLFQQAASKRYGIEFCCPMDFDDLDIKKQLLDLKMITDPDACKPIPCCAPCNTIAELLTFSPIACPAPTLVSAILVPPPTVVGKDCRLIRFSPIDGDPAAPRTFTGFLCTGVPIFINIPIGSASQVHCIDVSLPFTKDPLLNGSVVGVC